MQANTGICQSTQSQMMQVERELNDLGVLDKHSPRLDHLSQQRERLLNTLRSNGCIR